MTTANRYSVERTAYTVGMVAMALWCLVQAVWWLRDCLRFRAEMAQVMDDDS